MRKFSKMLQSRKCTENEGVAFETEGVRNESKTDGNKTVLMYHQTKIVLPQMMREDRLDVM